MSILLNIVFPIFAIILAGYLCGRFHLLSPDATSGINQYVYWVALPALLFKAMAVVDVGLILDPDFFGAFVGGQAIAMTFAMTAGLVLFGNTLAESGVNGMNSVYGNTGFLGIPLALAAFGEKAAVPTIITVVVNSALVIAAAIAIVEFSHNRGTRISVLLRNVSKAICKNPMLVSPALGLIWALQSEPLPDAILRFCDLLGSSAGPCALFAIGLFLVGKPLASGRSEVLVMVFAKLVLHPVLTWLLAVWVFDLKPLWIAVAVLMAAMPTGAGSFVLAQQYQIKLQRTSSIILVSTIISVVTIFLLLQHFHPLLITE